MMLAGKKWTLLLPLLLLAPAVRGAEPAKTETGVLIVVDSRGKEHKIKSWQFLAGTRRLSWLAPAPAKAPAKAKAEDEGERPGRAARRPRVPVGPEALSFRPETEIAYVEGVTTLIPVERIRSIEFDNEENLAKVHVVNGPKPEDDIVLEGSTKYRGINKVVLEAEEDRGEDGVAAVKFRGGVPDGIRAIRFPAPQAPAKSEAGRPAVVSSKDGKKTSIYPVHDLLALYRLNDGSEKLLPTLMFKKTLKLNLAKIQKIVQQSGEDEGTSWQVIQKGGDDTTLTLLTTLPLDGKPAELEGLLGRIPAGYRFFPVASIDEVKFDATSADEPKEKDKEQDK